MRNSRGLGLFLISDDQVVLTALSSYEWKSKVIMDCFTTPNTLGKYNNLTLNWLPSPKTTRADCLVKKKLLPPRYRP